MRLSDLRDLRVRTLDGKALGRVHEVHSDGGRVTAIMCGAGSFIERLTSNKGGRRIPWENVRKIDRKHILVVLGSSPGAAKKASAARNRQGTPRPTAPRSKR